MRERSLVSLGLLAVFVVLWGLSLWKFCGRERVGLPASSSLEGERAAESPRSPAAPVAAADRQAVEVDVAAPVAEPESAADEEPRTEVRVRFVDESGAPIAGAELLVRARPTVFGRSLANGIVDLELDDSCLATSQLLVFRASCSGFATDERSATAVLHQRLLLGDWTLVDGGSVAGRAVDRAGRGVSGVEVACRMPEEGALDWEEERRGRIDQLARPGARAVTDAGGAFRLDDVPAGRIRLVAVAEDRPAAATDFIEVPAGGLVSDVVIRMDDADGGTDIVGVVLDPEGRGVPRARIRVEATGTTHSMSADADGRFRVRCRDKGPRDLFARDPEQRHRQATRVGVLPGTKDVVLGLARAPEVELAVRSEGGGAIENFAVALVAMGTEQPLASFPSAERPGGLLVLGAPSEDFRVEVRANGWRAARLGPFAGAAPPTRIECRLERAGGVKGVITAGGAPVSGAVVELYARSETKLTYNGFPVRSAKQPVNGTLSEPDGIYALSVEEPGTYFVRVEDLAYAPAEVGPLCLAPDAERIEDVALDQGGAIAVQVRSARGASVAGMLVALSRGDGFAATLRTDESGELVVSQLTPGPWQVALSKVEIDPMYGATYESGEPAREVPSNCRVFAGETTHVVLWLETRGDDRCRLTGRLTIDGKPAEGWLARLDEGGEAAGELQAFLEPGLFRLGSEEPGSYRLSLLRQGPDPSAYRVLFDPVELVEGESHWSLSFDTGELEGVLSAAARGAESDLVFLRWTRGELQCLAPLVPDAGGRFRCPGVPAGRGELVRFDPAQPMEEQTPAVLGTVVVEKGKTARIEL